MARTLAEMTGSPVLTVPALSRVLEELLGVVYVFTNGVRGDGPPGFQPNVFDRPPGDAGYTPLRRVHRVTWKPGREARLLKSGAEVREAESRGELAVEPTHVVVNVPFVAWPGGRR